VSVFDFVTVHTKLAARLTRERLQGPAKGEGDTRWGVLGEDYGPGNPGSESILEQAFQHAQSQQQSTAWMLQKCYDDLSTLHEEIMNITLNASQQKIKLVTGAMHEKGGCPED